MPNPHLHLHHVGYIVALIEPAAALYVSRFGYRAASPIIHDPLQTALVQFLRLPGDSTYLEFVAPDSPASRLTAEAARARPLHHLCFRTYLPLEQAAEALRAQAMVQIAEPRVATAFAGRRICWLMGADRLPIELLEARTSDDFCEPTP